MHVAKTGTKAATRKPAAKRTTKTAPKKASGKLVLVDGHSAAFRAFFAIRELNTTDGTPVNAVFGFTKMLIKLLKDERPDYIAVAFDTSAPTFRHEQYEAYKGNRSETPEDFIPQVPLIIDVLQGMNIPVITKDGYEADDIIATLAHEGEQEGLDVVIVTHDKDIMQCVTDHISVLNPHGETTLYDAAKVKEKYGVRPDQIVDLLGLAGDTVDNIPGVPGVGVKTAAALLEEFGDMETVLASVDKISGKKRKENLEQYADQARMSRELAQICYEVPLGVTPHDLKRKDVDRAALAPLLRKLEFRSITRDLLGEEEAAEVAAAKADAQQARAEAAAAAVEAYTTVTTEEQLKSLVREMKRSATFAVDTETTSQDPMRAELVGLSFSCRDGIGYYIPVGHTAGGDLIDGHTQPEQLPLDVVFKHVRPLLDDPRYGKVGQNIKYDTIVFAEAGVPTRGVVFDTMVASGLIDASRMQHNLDALAKDYLDHDMIPISDLIGKGKNQISMAEVPVEQASEYACEDADITWRVYELMEPKIEDRGVTQLFHDVEMPLVQVLERMERRGIGLDTKALAQLHTKIEKRLKGLEGEIYDAAGHSFNIMSTQQLGTVLFDEIGLKATKKTKTGYSTDSTVLEQLSAEHPLPGLILEYRELAKLDSTYVQSLPQQINPKTGRIHTSYNQTGAATGRLSSKDPNLQNIPIRTPLGQEVRRAFVASEPGCVLLSADYSQIELRILAHITEDPILLEAFNSGVDIHARTSSEIFGVPLDKVTPDQRRKAKIANFGLMYGMGPVKLAADMGISRAEAKDFIDKYFTAYPGIRRYMDRVVDEARTNGYVTTVLNRRRDLPDINSSKPQLRAFAERAAINTPIQGSAADVIKVAMIELDRLLTDHPTWHMLLQVHDELVFELPAADVDEASDVIRHTMATAYPLRVPVVVEVGHGANWLDAH